MILSGKPLHVIPEIIEDANEVAVKVGGDELAQLPRLILGFGNELRLRGLPLCKELVDLNPAVEIEPEKNRPCIAVGFSEGAIGNEQSATSLETLAIPP
jgi:hypothetical protein